MTTDCLVALLQCFSSVPCAAGSTLGEPAACYYYGRSRPATLPRQPLVSGDPIKNGLVRKHVGRSQAVLTNGPRHALTSQKCRRCRVESPGADASSGSLSLRLVETEHMRGGLRRQSRP